MIMFETVKEIVYEITGKEGLALDTDFVKDLQLNSFDIVNIICAFEQRYRIRIKTQDLWKLHTVKDVLEYMKSIGLE